MSRITYVTEHKTVPEKKCRTVPDQECEMRPRFEFKPVNTTECKTVKEKKCWIENVPEEENECTEVQEKSCRPVLDKVTEIVQVLVVVKMNHMYCLIFPGR